MSDFPRLMTNGEKYNPAMQITDQAEANVYFGKCVNHCMLYGKKDIGAAHRIERANIRYWAGLYDENMRVRVHKLFKTRPPILGKPRPADEFAVDQEQAPNLGDCIVGQRKAHEFLVRISQTPGFWKEARQ